MSRNLKKGKDQKGVKVKTSSVGVDFIKGWEKYRGYVYPDASGVPTIYYGHVVLPGESFNGTALEGVIVLRRDLLIAESAVARLIKVPLTPNMHAALVSFTFNLGGGALQRSALRSRLNRGEYAYAAEQFGRWVFDNGRRLKGLVRRRAAERVLFLS